MSDSKPALPLKRDVLGIEVSVVDYDTAVAQILRAAAAPEPMTVTALAVHGVMTGVLDREHQWRLNQFDLVCPDGQPVRWALNLLHRAGLKQRVYGPELTLRTCQACAEADIPVYLFGATDEMLSALKTKLQEKFPKLRIVGMQASKFRPIDAEEQEVLAKEIRDSGARVCFVGLGCPRQEVFAYEMRERIGMPMLAVGAAFAFHAGMLAQAPPWMQRWGLEWFYRLTREPRRLWRRYVYLNPLFLSLLAAQKLGLRRDAAKRAVLPRTECRYG